MEISRGDKLVATIDVEIAAALTFVENANTGPAVGRWKPVADDYVPPPAADQGRAGGDSDSIKDDVLIVANDATLFRHAHHLCNVMWIHNPLALEKAVRKGQMVPIIRHRPHAVFGGPLAEQVCSRVYPFASRNAIPLGISRPFLSSRLDQPRSPVFVWASQQHRGLKQTVEAWLRAVPCMPGASFHIFGATTESTGHTDTQIRNASIVLHPRLTKPNLAAFYETASAMIYPGAQDETFCLAASEAQCVGLPVITLGIGSLSERVQHGTNGLTAGT